MYIDACIAMNEIISEKKLDHFTPTCKVEYKQAYISE
jgi:hypothetical protein